MLAITLGNLSLSTQSYYGSLRRVGISMLGRPKIEPAGIWSDARTSISIKRLVCTAVSGNHNSALWGVLDELLATSVLIAATTSIVRAVSTGRKVHIGHSTMPHRPMLPLVYSATPRAWLEKNLGSTQMKHFDRVYGALAGALASLPVGTIFWSSGSATPECQILAKSWGLLCADVCALLRALCDHGAFIGFHQWGRAFEIEGMVNSARHGGLPCIRSDGAVMNLDWQYKRREPRVPVNVHITMSIPYSTHRVRVRDMSLSGLGIVGSPSLASNTAVTLKLPYQTQLQGTVAWSFGGNLGVKLLAPLVETDPVVRMMRTMWSFQ